MLFYIRKILSYISLMWSRGTLSDKDIKKLLGYHIFIYPFKEENLKPASYNLTASKCAFVKDKEGNQKLIVCGNKIKIPPHETGIIETQESIYVSKWITGTYHSKVKMANKGIGHIGTTLDPCFFGVSAIALHNTTNKPIEIKVGDTIATLIFSSLKSRSTGIHDNISGRQDDGIKLDVQSFYYKDDDKDVNILIKVKADKNENIDKKFIKNILEDSEIIIYDEDKDVCNKCINCNDQKNCNFKLMKNSFGQRDENEQILKEIEEWRNQEWVNNKESLINVVVNMVKNKNNNKDIGIYSAATLFIGIGAIIALSVFVYYKPKYQNFIGIVIASIIPTVTLIISMIVRHKKGKEE